MQSRTSLVAGLILLMVLPAFGNIKMTGFSSGFGWSSRSSTFASLGIVLNSNYHIAGMFGRPLFKRSYGTDIQDENPFAWWVEKGREVDYHIVGFQFNRIFNNRFSLGTGYNLLYPKYLIKYRSETTDLGFSKTVSSPRQSEMTLQVRYMLFSSDVSQSLNDPIPIVLGLVYGTSGHFGLEISVAIL